MSDRSWYVYILRCVDNVLYTGITPDVEKRLAAHNARKGAAFTAGRTPCTVVYVEEVGTLSDALKRERRIKKMTREGRLTLIGQDIPPPTRRNDGSRGSTVVRALRSGARSPKQVSVATGIDRFDVSVSLYRMMKAGLVNHVGFAEWEVVDGSGEQ